MMLSAARAAPAAGALRRRPQAKSAARPAGRRASHVARFKEDTKDPLVQEAKELKDIAQQGASKLKAAAQQNGQEVGCRVHVWLAASHDGGWRDARASIASPARAPAFDLCLQLLDRVRSERPDTDPEHVNGPTKDVSQLPLSKVAMLEVGGVIGQRCDAGGTGWLPAACLLLLLACAC